MKVIISSFKRSGVKTFSLFVGLLCTLLVFAKAPSNGAGVASARTRSVAPKGPSLPRVALVHADVPSFATDVHDKLVATGRFSQVDIIDGNSTTPTLAQLKNYNSVLVWTDNQFNDPTTFGNNLADYIDAGGGVVIGSFANFSGHMSGRFDSEDYRAQEAGGCNDCGIEATLGTIYEPTSPLMAGVTSFDGGTQSFRTRGSPNVAAIRVADWSDGDPLIVRRNINSTRRVDLNFFPPSKDGYSGSWIPSTDGATIIANALTYAGPSTSISLVPPFIGDRSETWEEFATGCSTGNQAQFTILGDTATISDANSTLFVYDSNSCSFGLCSFGAGASDGTHGVGLNSAPDVATITFSTSVNDFGAYWGVATKACGNGFNQEISFVFKDADGNVVDTDSFFYDSPNNAGALEWRGWHFNTPVKTVTYSGNYVVTDGMQVLAGCAPAPAGFVSWWKGEDNANDSQGDNNGTVNGATFASGEVGQAFTFDGIDDDVSIPDSSDWNFGTGDFTFDFWEKSNVDPNYREYALSFEPVVSTRNLDFNFNDGGAGIYLYWNSGGSNQILYGTAGQFTDGQWHHIALTRSGTLFTLYVDGLNVNSTYCTGACSNVMDLSGAANNFIGAYQGNSFFWDGQIDEVEVFNRALSDAEVASIYIAGSNGKCPCTPAPDGLVSWWRGEGDTVDTADNNNGTFNGNVAYGPGAVEQAFSFDGNSYVDVPDATNLHFTTDFTLDAWINPTDLSNPADIVNRFHGAQNSYELVVFPDGHLTLFISPDGSGSHDEVQSNPGVISTNQWQHVAATFNNGVATLFVNGSQVASSTLSFTAAFPGSQDLWIGGGVNFVGFIDEVEAFNRALTPDEIASIYDAGGAGKCRECDPAPGGMIHWWPANGDAKDVQGENNGTEHGGTTFSAGKVQDAFNFDGSTGYVDVGPIDLPATFTIDAWINAISIANSPAVIANIDSNNNGYFVLIESDGSLFAYVLSSAVTTYQSAPAITVGGWHHIAVSYDGGAGNGEKFKFYVDGALVPVAHANTEAGGTPNHSAASALIGAYQASSNFFTGSIDELELYDRVLSQPEVQKIYDAGSKGKCPCVTPPNNLVSWWPGDDNGLDVQNGNTLTFYNGEGFVSGEVSDAFNFPGGRAASPGLPSNLNITGNQVTIDGWVNLNTTQSQGLFFGKSESGQNDYALFMLAGQLAGSIRTADGIEHFLYTGLVPPSSQWMHIAMTYDGTSQTIYANGAVVAQQSVSGNVRGDNVNFWIGGRSSGNDLTINAAIDEVEVFNRALGQSEIAAIYHAAGAGKCKPQTHVIAVSASPANGGSVSGGGTYQTGTQATVIATPNSCYQFVNWTEGNSVVSTSASYSFTVTADRTLVAHFSKIQYNIAVSASPTAGGSVTGGGSYDCGAQVNLTATPNSCYHFVNWTEGNTVVSTSTNYSFTASANRTLVANFAINQYTISATASPFEGGFVSGVGTYNCGSTATLTATPSSCYAFVNWTDGATVVSTSASYSFTVGSDRNLVAHFTKTDNNPPVITVPEDITVRAAKKKGKKGPNGAVVNFDVSANDPETGPVPAIASPPSGSVFPIGTTVVTVTASDNCGNTATKTFTVTVRGGKH